MYKNLKQVNQFAIPLIIQFIASYMIGIIDSAIIARVSIDAFNAVNLVYSTLSMIAGLLGCITIVFNIRGGEKIGGNDKEGLSFEFFTSLFLSITIGLFSIIIIHFLSDISLTYLYNAEGELLVQSLIYLKTMKYYVFLQLILFVLTTIFKIQNKTKIILVSSTVATFINIILDLLFVLGIFGLPKLGIFMAGFSNIISMVVSIVIYFYLIRSELVFVRKSFKKYTGNVYKHIKSSITLFLQEIIDGAVFVVIINMIIIRIGTLDYATYSVIGYIVGLLIVFKYVYGSAILSLGSVYLGEKDIVSLKNAPKITSYFVTILYCLVATITFILRRQLTAVITNDNEVIVHTSTYIVYFFIANVPGISAYIYQSGLQSLSESKYVLYSTAIVNIVTLCLMVFFTNILSLGLIGIALSRLINEVIINYLYRKKYNCVIKSIVGIK